MKNIIKDALGNIFLGSLLKCHRVNVMGAKFVNIKMTHCTVQLPHLSELGKRSSSCSVPRESENQLQLQSGQSRECHLVTGEPGVTTLVI